MHKAEFILENDMHKVLCDFEIQNRHLIMAQKARTSTNQQQQRRGPAEKVDIAVPADNKMKMKESETIDKYMDLARELKNDVECEGDDDSNYSCYTGNSFQMLGTGPSRLQYC